MYPIENTAIRRERNDTRTSMKALRLSMSNLISILPSSVTVAGFPGIHVNPGIENDVVPPTAPCSRTWARK